MSNKDFSQQINITSHCSADWDSMIGNDQIRFCQHCQLSVNNLDSMSRKRVRRLIAKSSGRLCVRYSSPTTLKLAASPDRVLHKIGRRTSAIAAGAFTASLGISSALAGNLNIKHVARTTYQYAACPAAHLTETALVLGGGIIRGIVFDPNGAVITGATVLLTPAESKDGRIAISNGSGEYKFEGLEPGTYNLKIEASGFAASDVPNITLRANDNNRIDQTLSIASITAEVDVIEAAQEMIMGGGMAVAPREPLVKAAQQDDLDAVKEALLGRTNANVRDKDTDSTALEFAVRNANREMVQVLLWAKADVNARDSDGQTILMMLGENVTNDIVWDLLNAGAKVNARDSDGDTALIEAAQINNVDALKTLLDAGAKVNESNNDGETALMMAAAEGLVNNVRALILAGADINVPDKEGKSALMYANKHDHRAAARLLKSHGAVEFEETEKQ